MENKNMSAQSLWICVYLMVGGRALLKAGDFAFGAPDGRDGRDGRRSIGEAVREELESNSLAEVINANRIFNGLLFSFRLRGRHYWITFLIIPVIVCYQFDEVFERSIS